MKLLAFPMVLMMLFLFGCHNTGQGSSVGANQTLSQLPAPVAAAFRNGHPGVTPTRVHPRLFPDGTTRYQVNYLDAAGRPQQADYYADGRSVPQSS